MDGVSKEINHDLNKKIESMNGFVVALTLVDGRMGQFFSRVFLLEPEKKV